MHAFSKSIRSLAVLAMFSASVGVVSAQSSRVKIDGVVLDLSKPKYEDLKSPRFSANTKTKNWKSKEWLEAELKIEVKDIKARDSRTLPKDKTIPKMTVKWFVAVKDPNSKKQRYLLLEKEVKHVNVPIKEEVYSSVYISPSGIRRLTNGGDRASDSVIFEIGGEITVEGSSIKMGKQTGSKVFFSSTGKKWWETESDKIAQSNLGIDLHNKNETPFRYFWWDRYAEIEIDKNAEKAAE